jgi:hypothetical protein
LRFCADLWNVEIKPFTEDLKWQGNPKKTAIRFS